MLKGSTVTIMEWEHKYGKMYGTYEKYNPVLNVSDLDMVKHILIKDFHLFVDRRSSPSLNKIDQRQLFHLKGDDWKRVRAITSPTFTSGKLKGMSGQMDKCVDKLSKFFNDCVQSPETSIIDTKKVITGFTIDVIASTSFAMDTDANGDRSKTNPFVERAMKMFKFTFARIFYFLMTPMFIREFLDKFINSEVNGSFFHKLAEEVVRMRRSTNVKRNDFVQLLMDARVDVNELKNSGYETLTADADRDDREGQVAQTLDSNNSKTKNLKTLDDTEIMANIILFFVAGFETTASTITHSLFELAKNPETQDRLYQELNDALDGVDTSSELYYETVLTKVPYLEAVMKETLRKYPPLARLDRRVNVDGYKLGNVTLEKNQLVLIPAVAIHYNPEYYPEPNRFNPDRFMPENRDQLIPYTYMPFGQGPRNCIGMRFAYQEVKLCLAKLIRQFRFEPTDGTPDKLKLGKIALTVAETFPLKVSKR